MAAANTDKLDRLAGIRERLVPILEVAASRYVNRVPTGYPNVIDDPSRALVGFEIDPDYAMYVSADESGPYVEMYWRDPRTDNRSGASREKFAGAPHYDRRPLDPAISDQGLRNLVSELMSHFNFQPGLIYITDD